MMKLIIADDEPVILKGIRKLVDWERIGISIVGEYEDGRSAMEGILAKKPELALLDISMPEMDGIEILKNISRLALPTKVIFVSGFQDFEYARSAITYGAVEYLLKPLIREELLEALEKAEELLNNHTVRLRRREDKGQEPAPKKQGPALEETTYLPVLAQILFDGTENEQVRKLVSFSFVSFLEEYLADHRLGILFEKSDNTVMVFKGISAEDAREELLKLQEKVREITGRKTAFVMGRVTDTMSRIPEEYERCLPMKRYFFFEGQIGAGILQAGEKVFSRQVNMAELSEARGRMMDSIFALDEKAFDAAFEQFARVLCLSAQGRREDASYYFCSSVRLLEEKMSDMNLRGEEHDMGRLLEGGRACVNYEQMKNFYRECLRGCQEQLRAMLESNDRKDIVYARAYIEEHYAENLSLEVMAGIVHMNPYYFSSFFKKNAGENFKDYVNKVRISHAVSLLLSTDMKAYEIAMETGFRDARAFTEAFSRIYGETPSSYKKRALERKKQEF